jgi:hypothetical protein
LSDSFRICTIGGNTLKQNVRVFAIKDEVAADHEGIPATIIRGDAAIRLALKYCVRVDRRQIQVAREAERPPVRQHDAIPRRQANNAVGNALDSQPALAGDHGIAFDTLMLREPDGNVARIEAAGLVTARFQQR